MPESVEIICGRVPRCPFRVHDRYFEERRDRFPASHCPNCGGPIEVVEAYTDTKIGGAAIEIWDSQGNLSGRVHR